MARRSDALGEAWGPDGTQPSAGVDALRAADLGTDATAPSAFPLQASPPQASPTSTFPADASAVPIPRLPPFPTSADSGAVERWMAEDRAEHRVDPPPQPYRVLPSKAAPPPEPRAIPAAGPPSAAPVDERAEEPWVRERREEQEFLREFGQWRAGVGVPRARMQRSTLVSPQLLLLVGVIVVVVLYYLGGG